MAETPPTEQPRRNFYGRRRGKSLKGRQADLVATRLKALSPPGVRRDDNPERAPLDLEALFGRSCPVWLEIGFGAGEHMLAQAEANPHVGVIGCEPYINGVASLLSKLDRVGCENVRIHPGDARDMLDVLPEASIDRAFLLYPDPWPKARHHRRRFTNAENLVAIARALKPGAHLRIATDIPDYVRHTLEAAERVEGLTWCADRPADWRAPWPDWHRTRYEAKALREGRTPHYLTFRRD